MEYVEIEKDDVRTIAELSEANLTHGDTIINRILEDVREGRYYGVKAIENGKMAGFYTYVDDSIEFTTPQSELEKKIAEIADGGKVVTGDSIFIYPEFQHRGLGQELARRVSGLARAHGGKYFITEAWIHPDGSIPSHKALLCNGEVVFEKVIPMFYKDIWKLGMECPICGRNCVCGAEIQLHKL